MQMNRLFEMVYLLLDRKQMTAKDLAAHFEVSQRTVYRDVETLSQAGIPIYAAKGAGGGIRLTETFILNKSLLSERERQSVLASLQGMRALQVDTAEAALEKLSALFGGEGEDWISVDFSSWNPENPVSARFDALKDAIFARQVVSFAYSGANGKTEVRRVEPLKLVFRGYDWYLLGWCRTREDFRFFKLSRMEHLERGRESFVRRRVPPDSIGKGEGYAAPMLSVEARICREKAYRVLEEFPAAQREAMPDGSYLVRFQMPDNQWLLEYLLTYGSALEVLSPPKVRAAVVSQLKKAIEAYEI